MKLQPSKKFAKYVDEFVKRTGLAECAEHKLVDSFNYPGFHSYGCDPYDDYDSKSGLFKVVAVFYPYEYYAPCTYITSHAIDDAYKELGFNGNISTEQLDELLKLIIEI